MPNLFGGIEVLDEVESLTGNVRVSARPLICADCIRHWMRQATAAAS